MQRHHRPRATLSEEGTGREQTEGNKEMLDIDMGGLDYDWA
jgi:hypothetical protein